MAYTFVHTFCVHSYTWKPPLKFPDPPLVIMYAAKASESVGGREGGMCIIRRSVMLRNVD